MGATRTSAISRRRPKLSRSIRLSRRPFFSKLREILSPPPPQSPEPPMSTPKPPSKRINTFVSKTASSHIVIPILSSQQFVPLPEPEINPHTLQSSSDSTPTLPPDDFPISNLSTYSANHVETLTPLHTEKTLQHTQFPPPHSLLPHQLHDRTQFTSIQPFLTKSPSLFDTTTQTIDILPKDSHSPHTIELMSSPKLPHLPRHSHSDQNFEASYHLPIIRVGASAYGLLQVQLASPNVPHLRLLGGRSINGLTSIESASVHTHYQTNSTFSQSLDGFNSLFDIQKSQAIARYREHYNDHEFYTDEQLALRLLHAAPLFLDFFPKIDQFDDNTFNISLITTPKDQISSDKHNYIDDNGKLIKVEKEFGGQNMEKSSKSDQESLNTPKASENQSDPSQSPASEGAIKDILPARITLTANASTTTTGRVIATHLYHSDFPVDPPSQTKQIHPIPQKIDPKTDTKTNSIKITTPSSNKTPTVTSKITIQRAKQPHAVHIIDMGSIMPAQRDSLDPAIFNPYIPNCLIYPKLFEHHSQLYNRTGSPEMTYLASLLMASQSISQIVQRYTNLYLKRQQFNLPATISSLASIQHRARMTASDPYDHTYHHPAPFGSTLQPWYSTVQSLINFDTHNGLNELSVEQIDKFFQQDYGVSPSSKLIEEATRFEEILHHDPQLKAWFLPILHHLKHPLHSQQGQLGNNTNSHHLSPFAHQNAYGKPLWYRSPHVSMPGRGKRGNAGDKIDFILELLKQNENGQKESPNDPNDSDNNNNNNKRDSYSKKSGSLPYDIAPSIQWVPLVDLLHLDPDLQPRFIRQKKNNKSSPSLDLLAPPANLSCTDSPTQKFPLDDMLGRQPVDINSPDDLLRAEQSRHSTKNRSINNHFETDGDDFSTKNTPKNSKNKLTSDTDPFAPPSVDNIDSYMHIQTLKSHYGFIRPDLVDAFSAWTDYYGQGSQITPPGGPSGPQTDHMNSNSHSFHTPPSQTPGITPKQTISTPLALNSNDYNIILRSSPHLSSFPPVESRVNELGQLITTTIGNTYPIRQTHHELLLSSFSHVSGLQSPSHNNELEFQGYSDSGTDGEEGGGNYGSSLADYLGQIVQQTRMNAFGVVGEARILQKAVQTQTPTMFRDLGFSMVEIADIIEQLPQKEKEIMFRNNLGSDKNNQKMFNNIGDDNFDFQHQFDNIRRSSNQYNDFMANISIQSQKKKQPYKSVIDPYRYHDSESH